MPFTRGEIVCCNCCLYDAEVNIDAEGGLPARREHSVIKHSASFDIVESKCTGKLSFRAVSTLTSIRETNFLSMKDRSTWFLFFFKSFLCIGRRSIDDEITTHVLLERVE